MQTAAPRHRRPSDVLAAPRWRLPDLRPRLLGPRHKLRKEPRSSVARLQPSHPQGRPLDRVSRPRRSQTLRLSTDRSSSSRSTATSLAAALRASSRRCGRRLALAARRHFRLDLILPLLRRRRRRQTERGRLPTATRLRPLRRRLCRQPRLRRPRLEYDEAVAVGLVVTKALRQLPHHH